MYGRVLNMTKYSNAQLLSAKNPKELKSSNLINVLRSPMDTGENALLLNTVHCTKYFEVPHSESMQDPTVPRIPHPSICPRWRSLPGIPATPALERTSSPPALTCPKSTCSFAPSGTASVAAQTAN